MEGQTFLLRSVGYSEISVKQAEERLKKVVKANMIGLEKC